MYHRLLFFILCVTFILLGIFSCRHENNLSETRSTIIFLDPGKRAEQLLVTDPVEGYFGHVTAADISLQMGLATGDSVSLIDYREWLGKRPIAWPNALRKRLRKLWGQVLVESETAFPGLAPDSIYLILTADEPYGAHVYFTRNMAVVIPETDLRTAPEASLLHTLRHELFHLISRKHYGMRPNLYGVANFVAGPETDSLRIPPGLAKRALTNPDAPNLDYTITYQGKGYLPYLFCPEVPEKAEDEFYFSANIRSDYRQLEGYAVTDLRLAEWKVKAAAEANSNYLIHPEEILAEHFAFLLGGAKVDNPEELEQLAKKLSGEE